MARSRQPIDSTQFEMTSNDYLTTKLRSIRHLAGAVIIQACADIKSGDIDTRIEVKRWITDPTPAVVEWRKWLCDMANLTDENLQNQIKKMKPIVYENT